MYYKKIGYLYTILAATFFALIAVIGKTAINTGLSVFDLFIMQNVLAFLVLFIYFSCKGLKQLTVSKITMRHIVIQSLVGSGTTVFFYLALDKVNAGIASMLLFTNPVWVFLYFILTRTRKMNTVNNVALVLAVLGSAMVINIFGADVQHMPTIGILYGLAASFCYAFYNVFADLKLSQVEPLVITFYSSIVNLMVSLAINFDFIANGVTITQQSFIYAAELAVISGILPIYFLYKGIARIGADKASIVATAELPITLVFAFLALGERMSVFQLSGVFLILFSVIILQKESDIMAVFSIPPDHHD